MRTDAVIAEEQPLDCQECRSAGSVVRDVCQICFAELDQCQGLKPPRTRVSARAG